MTIPRLNRSIKTDLGELALAFLTEDPGIISDEFARLDYEFSLMTGRPTGKAIVDEHGEAFLAEWIRQRPCTRPQWWWLWKSPQKCRKRAGGTGLPEYTRLNVAVQYLHGMVTGWLTQIDLEIFPDTVKPQDIVDLSDPPRYESQASFLQRHNLLTPAEQRHLAQHPELLEPEAIPMEWLDQGEADNA